MNFVDDEDLITVASGSDPHTGNDCIANIIHSRIGSSVDLQYINRSAFANFTTRRALIGIVGAAWRCSWLFGLVTVERFGEKPGGCGLSYATCAREQVGMMQALVFNCISQRASNCFLARYFFERLRAPFARDDLIRHVG